MNKQYLMLNLESDTFKGMKADFNELLQQLLEKLKAEFPSDWDQRIQRLSEYMASSGKSYKNHLATIRNWARRDKPAAKAVGGEDMTDLDKYF